jgi:hypothetical protein
MLKKKIGRRPNHFPAPGLVSFDRLSEYGAD